jgi:outer membrane receptor protein involved in Fe transport
LIPLNAIERFDVFPGSNPLFGLNTLGGALSLRTRNGFSSPGIEASALGGSFGRRQIQTAVGENNGRFAGFAALHYFDEDGWRDESPSTVKQFFARADWRGDSHVLGAKVLLADNRLIGNGLVPEELFRIRPETVLTAPDRSQNKLRQFAIDGAYDATDVLNITAQIYRRLSDRDGLNGDAYEGFDELSTEHDYVDINGVRYARNGAIQNNGAGGVTSGTGIVDGSPIGLLTTTALGQTTNGGALQSNWNLPRHKFMLGASLDRSQAAYRMSQRLGLIDAAHTVYLAPGDIAAQYYAASHDIPGNDFHGTGTTYSAYLNETWSMLDNFHLTLAGRYNQTKVASDLRVRADTGDLHELRANNSDLDRKLTELIHTAETYRYSSFNPQIGLNWLPIPSLNLFGNVSRGARVPSVVELGCAFDSTPVDITVGNVPATAPRSLLGPGCSLPTTLSGDPYLPQIRSKSGEVGARGTLWKQWDWNASLYRTDLKNDLYFVGVGDGKSYFDTIGKTRRQGLEAGFKGRVGIVDLRLGYSYTEATFQSTFYTLSPHNSSADFDQNSQSIANLPGLAGSNTLPSPTAGANGGRGTYHMIRIDPGATLPGIPRQNFNGGFTLHATQALRFGLSVIAHTGSFVRGDENNQHTTGSTDQETGLYLCTQGGGCAGTGLQQVYVRRGRPFNNSSRVPGFAVVNLDATYEIRKGWVLSGEVGNLFDRDYFTAGRLGVNPFSPSVNGAIGPSGWNYNSSEWRNSTYIGPGAPRGVWLEITYSTGGADR